MSEMQQILCQIEANMTTPEFKAHLFALLARMGLYHLPRSSLLHYRAQTTIKLMENGTRPEVRDSLQQRFGISRRSAYRLICRSIDVRQGKLFD